MKKHIIVFDIDGTLSIVGDRVKHLESKNWNSFYDECDQDLINEPIAQIYYAMTIFGFPIKVVTGRVERTREKTLNWFKKHHLKLESSDLYMRKDKDFRSDTIVKPELVASFIDEIQMIFEDRACVVNKWRELGITCLQVAEGNF